MAQPNRKISPYKIRTFFLSDLCLLNILSTWTNYTGNQQINPEISLERGKGYQHKKIQFDRLGHCVQRKAMWWSGSKRSSNHEFSPRRKIFMGSYLWWKRLVEKGPSEKIHGRQQKKLCWEYKYEQSWVSYLGSLQNDGIHHSRKYLLDCREWKTNQDLTW